MSESVVKSYPCSDCSNTSYVGFGAYRCNEAAETCARKEEAEWVGDLAVFVAEQIAKAHHVRRETREATAERMADAIADLLYDLGGKFDDDAFRRRCDVPRLRT